MREWPQTARGGLSCPFLVLRRHVSSTGGGEHTLSVSAKSEAGVRSAVGRAREFISFEFRGFPSFRACRMVGSFRTGWSAAPRHFGLSGTEEAPDWHSHSVVSARHTDGIQFLTNSTTGGLASQRFWRRASIGALAAADRQDHNQGQSVPSIAFLWRVAWWAAAGGPGAAGVSAPLGFLPALRGHTLLRPRRRCVSIAGASSGEG